MEQRSSASNQKQETGQVAYYVVWRSGGRAGWFGRRWRRWRQVGQIHCSLFLGRDAWLAGDEYKLRPSVI